MHAYATNPQGLWEYPQDGIFTTCLPVLAVFYSSPGSSPRSRLEYGSREIGNGVTQTVVRPQCKMQ